MTIAGHDPSAGAGLTADIKTFDAFGLYGLSVCTAVTVQNDVDFKASHWVDVAIILEQIETLFERFQIDVVKIGIVESWDVLELIISTLKQLKADIKIVLDPVLKASAGFQFHEDNQVLFDLLKEIYIMTPNFDELKILSENDKLDMTIDRLTKHTNVYLKGGHRTDKLGLDEVFTREGDHFQIAPKTTTVFQKHGSGCVLSSALAAGLALGFRLEAAAERAKRYTEKFLGSTEGLLGKHNYNLVDIATSRFLRHENYYDTKITLYIPRGITASAFG